MEIRVALNWENHANPELHATPAGTAARRDPGVEEVLSPPDSGVQHSSAGGPQQTSTALLVKANQKIQLNTKAKLRRFRK